MHGSKISLFRFLIDVCVIVYSTNVLMLNYNIARYIRKEERGRSRKEGGEE